MMQTCARWINLTRVPAMLVAVAALAACNSSESTAPQATEAAAPAASESEVSLVPPGRKEFADAWSEACPSAKPVGKASCKSKGMAEPDFTCDFALGDDEYRRNEAELTRGQDRWELVNPAEACEVG